MKVTAIPAQITTVEDRITANLTLNQLLLLVTPLFLAVAIYFLLPPFGHILIYKAIVMLTIGLIFGSLAIRIKEKMIISWLSLRLAYELRPRRYVYLKSERLSIASPVPKQKSTTKDLNSRQLESVNPGLNLRELTRSKQLLESNNYRIVFKTNKKGGLNVQVGEA
jgi:hypothetical protein